MSTIQIEELRKEIENRLYMTNHSVYYEMRALKPGDNPEYGGKSFDGKIAIDRVMEVITSLIESETKKAGLKARIHELAGVYSNDYTAKTNVEVMKRITVEERMAHLATELSALEQKSEETK